jgi:FlaA1/EpsC-like NDP-sugar epimerase
MNTTSPAELSDFAETVGFVRKGIQKCLRALLSFADRHIGSNAVTRILAILLVYSAELSAAFWLAYEIRWDFAVPGAFRMQMLTLLGPVVLCKLIVLNVHGQFRSILSYFGLADLGGVVSAMGFQSALMLALWYASAITAAPPRGVILMDFLLSVSFVSAFRILLRIVRTWYISGQVKTGGAERRIAIIGAGDVGEALAKDLLQRRGSGLYPVLFVDDNPEKIGRSIHGLQVYGPLEKLPKLAAGARLDEFVITLPEATPKRIKEIMEVGRLVGATTRIIPSFTQLASGDVKVERSRPVAIEDLLGRAPVDLDGVEIGRLILDRVVMVTGAGGSIGSELCRQILSHGPRKLVLVEQAEIALFEIEQELVSNDRASCLVPLICDISDERGFEPLLSRYSPQIVFHAAAHKHVPLMERQPGEALKNNTLATGDIAALCSRQGVGCFVFISTDKAINPSSVMGCSKRLAELAILAVQNRPSNRTAFLTVRFGNVLGSSGSVIPVFRRQIAQGGPVTVTHRDMTRYFMTIPEAVGLVLQAAAIGRGGEIFILDMSEPVKIIDLARQMIELSGYKPDIDIEIKITGLRPGEKLFEELQHNDEAHERTSHQRIFKLRNQHAPKSSNIWMAELRQVAASGDPKAAKLAMKKLVPEYTPFNDAQPELPGDPLQATLQGNIGP